ncbi:MAG: hypothetical protein ABSE89_09485 [Sedimentisphaerales bacterium]
MLLTTIKRNGRYLFALAAIFVLAIISAVLLGQAVLKSCLLALVLVGFSGIVSILPVIRSVYLTSAVSSSCAIFSIALRLVIMLLGTASILFLTQISVLYFVLWLAVFYLPMITVEVLIILSLANGKKI